jgi:hypothetical protein
MEHGYHNLKITDRTFSECTNLISAKDHPQGQYPTGCPPFDKPIYGPIWKEVEAKKEGSVNSGARIASQ